MNGNKHQTLLLVEQREQEPGHQVINGSQPVWAETLQSSAPLGSHRPHGCGVRSGRVTTGLPDHVSERGGGAGDRLKNTDIYTPLISRLITPVTHIDRVLIHTGQRETERQTEKQEGDGRQTERGGREAREAKCERAENRSEKDKRGAGEGGRAGGVVDRRQDDRRNWWSSALPAFTSDSSIHVTPPEIPVW
ncbi:unnamed protein product [Pleuronectes platessa]|uniref:Uncharacterized protein n=1 Tax=Pleuronectes platessa TaxID=8262 RepID=A0A9N7V0P1_PLEPL|nr:unnamed protein product [Pleuronectes platessa]